MSSGTFLASAPAAAAEAAAPAPRAVPHKAHGASWNENGDRGAGAPTTAAGALAGPSAADAPALSAAEAAAALSPEQIAGVGVA